MVEVGELEQIEERNYHHDVEEQVVTAEGEDGGMVMGWGMGEGKGGGDGQHTCRSGD